MIIISLIFAIQVLYINLAPSMGNYEWDTHLLGLKSVLLLALIELYKNTDKKMVKKRAFLLAEIFFVTSMFFTYLSSVLNIPYVAEAVKGSLFTLWLVFLLYRKERTRSSKLNNKDIFAVRIKPKSFQDTLISMFGCGLGGYGVYYNGQYYHFRKGRFVKDSKKLMQAKKEELVIIKSQKYNKQTIDKLESMIGLKWSLRNNCVTKVRPLLRGTNNAK